MKVRMTLFLAAFLLAGVTLVWAGDVNGKWVAQVPGRGGQTRETTFNFKADEPMRGRAVQYIAWPVNTWEHLRKTAPGQFEQPVNTVPDPDGWFHAQIEVTDTQVRVFVNRAKEPSLVVARLARGGVQRPVGLFVDSAEGLYADLAVTPFKRPTP